MIRFHAPLIALTLLFAALPSAQAQNTLYWDTDGTGGAGSAAGTWDNITPNWSTDLTGASATQTWGQIAPPDDPIAFFSAGGGSAYNVTVSGNQAASGVTFQDNVVTLVPGTGGQLTLTGTTPTISLTSSILEDTINVPIAGTSGVTVAGSSGAKLILGGANTYTGNTTVEPGLKLQSGAANVIPDASVLVIKNNDANTEWNMKGFNETVKSISNGGTTGNAPEIYVGDKNQAQFATLTIADPANETTGAIFTYLNGVQADFANPHAKVVKTGTGNIGLNGALGTWNGGEFVLDQGTITIGANNAFGTAAAGSKLTINPQNRPEGVTISKSAPLGAVSMSTAYLDIGGNFTLTPTGPAAGTGLVTWQWVGNGAPNEPGSPGTPGQAANGRTLFTLKADNPVVSFTHAYSDNVGVATGHVIFNGTIRDDGVAERGITLAGGGTFTFTDRYNSYRGDTTITGGSTLRLTSDTVANHVDVGATAGNQDSNFGRVGTINIQGGTLSTSATFGVATTAGPRQNIVANPLNMVGDNQITWTVNSTFVATTETNMDFIFTSNKVAGSGTLAIRNRGFDASSTTNNKLFRAIFRGSGNDFNYSGNIAIQNYDASGNPTDNQKSRKAQLVSDNTTGTTQTWVGNMSGNGSFKRSAAGGTTVLNGANTFTGGVIVEGGTLTVQGANATLGKETINVTGGHVEISAGVLDAIHKFATLGLSGGGLAGADVAYISLAGGINEQIGVLMLGGAAQQAGTYGSTLSSATFKNDEYFAGTGILTVTNVPYGDYNQNGVVDGADYVVWRKNKGLTGGAIFSQGDGNEDGNVDDVDYEIWRGHFGNPSLTLPAGSGSGLNAGSTVPEPSSLLLLMVAGGSLLIGTSGFRRRRKG